MQTNRKAQMTRIRLNQEYRNKIANRMRVHLEQEDTIEKQNYDNLKGDQIDINDKAWKVAETIVFITILRVGCFFSFESVVLKTTDSTNR